MEKRYCKKCGRPLDHDDIEYCKGCYDYKNGRMHEEKIVENERLDKSNGLGTALKVISAIEIIVGIIAGIILFEDEFTIGLTVIIATIVSGLLVAGIGEIIQLLEDIKNKKE